MLSPCRNISEVIALSVSLALMLALPGSAAASGGGFTRAEANESWTVGYLAGAVSLTECAPPPDLIVEIGSCELLPYLTVGVGNDLTECAGADRTWPDPAQGVTIPWSLQGAGRGSFEFDLPSVALSGEAGQLACLAVFESYSARPSCWQDPEVACAQFIVLIEESRPLAGALLNEPIEAPSTPPEAPPAPPDHKGVGEDPTPKQPIPDTSAGEARDPDGSESAALLTSTSEPALPALSSCPRALKRVVRNGNGICKRIRHHRRHRRVTPQ